MASTENYQNRQICTLFCSQLKFSLTFRVVLIKSVWWIFRWKQPNCVALAQTHMAQREISLLQSGREGFKSIQLWLFKVRSVSIMKTTSTDGFSQAWQVQSYDFLQAQSFILQKIIKFLSRYNVRKVMFGQNQYPEFHRLTVPVSLFKQA